MSFGGPGISGSKDPKKLSTTVHMELESDECFKESAKEQVTNLQVNIDEVHEIDSDKIIDIARYVQPFATSNSACIAIYQQFDM